MLVVGVVALPMSAGDWARPAGARQLKPPVLDALSKTAKGAAKAAAAVEVRFIDDSKLKLTLTDARVELNTPYGALSVPVGDIRRIEFATRISEDEARRIETAAANLGSPQFRVREQAGVELIQLGSKAYTALLTAAKQSDPEVRRRAEKLLETLRESFPEDQLEFRKRDVVSTGDSTIAGHLGAVALKATTYQFGEVHLKLADMHSLRALSAAADLDSPTSLADPGNLTSLHNQIGKKFTFKVTGSVTGSVWGTDTYTSDSTLAVAAVHAGVLRPGQTGLVRVKIVAPPAGFLGSSRHGVTSLGYGAHPGAYEVLRKEKTDP
jgi:hypothetical protein